MQIVFPTIVLAILIGAETCMSFFIPKIFDNYQHDYKKIEGSAYNKLLYEVSLSANSVPKAIQFSVFIRTAISLLFDYLTVKLLLFLNTTTLGVILNKWALYYSGSQKEADETKLELLMAVVAALIFANVWFSTRKRCKYLSKKVKNYWTDHASSVMDKYFNEYKFAILHNDEYLDKSGIILDEVNSRVANMSTYSTNMLKNVVYRDSNYQAEGVLFDYCGSQAFIGSASTTGEGSARMGGVFAYISVPIDIPTTLHIGVSKCIDGNELSVPKSDFDYGTHIVELPDIWFSERFDVRSYDKIEAFIILNPQVSANIKALYDRLPKGSYIIDPEGIYMFSDDIRTNISTLQSHIILDEQFEDLAEGTYAVLDTLLDFADCFNKEV